MTRSLRKRKPISYCNEPDDRLSDELLENHSNQNQSKLSSTKTQRTIKKKRKQKEESDFEDITFNSNGEELDDHLISENEQADVLSMHSSNPDDEDNSHDLDKKRSSQKEKNQSEGAEAHTTSVDPAIEKQIMDTISSFLIQICSTKISEELVSNMLKFTKNGAGLKNKRRDHLDELSGAKAHAIVTKYENKNYRCFFPGCDKVFSNIPGMTYHIKNHKHDLSIIFKQMEQKEINSTPEKKQEISDSFKQMKNALSDFNLPIVIKDILFWIPGFVKPSLYSLNFVFTEAEQIKCLGEGKLTNVSVRISKLWSNYKIVFDPLPLASHFPSLSNDVDSQLSQLDQLFSFIPSDLEYVSGVEALEYFSSQNDQVPLNIIKGKHTKILNMDFLTGSWISEKAFAYLILNTNLSVWAMDWITNHSSTNDYDAYIAVGGNRSRSFFHVVSKYNDHDKDHDDMKNAIQIWPIRNLKSKEVSKSNTPIRATMCILQEFGCVKDLKWLPSKFRNNNSTIIGILAVVFCNGSACFFSIPKESDLKEKNDNPTHFIKIKPFRVLHLPGAFYTKLNWSKNGTLAIGMSDGSIVCYSIESLLRVSEYSTPKVYFRPHDSSVLSIDWIDDFCLGSTAMDGRLKLHDIRLPWQSVQLHRTKGFMHTSSFNPTYNKIFFTTIENSVREINLEHNYDENPVSNPSAGANVASEEGCALNTCTLSVHESTVWSLASTPFCPFVASCSSDGKFQVANSNRSQSKHKRPIIYLIYHLKLSKDKKLQMISTYSQTKTSEATKSINGFAIHDPLISIQNIAWYTPFFSSSESSVLTELATWIASGGNAGYVRIESVITSE